MIREAHEQTCPEFKKDATKTSSTALSISASPNTLLPLEVISVNICLTEDVVYDDVIDVTFRDVTPSITNLVELSLIQLKYLFQKLKINSKIVKESSITNKVDVSKLNASQRLFFHANYFKANIYITGINSLNYLDKTSFAEAKIYNYIQNFNYNFFNSHQKCKEPLSIVHQIANLGFKNISEWLFKESNFKKEEMINTFNSSLKKGFNQ